MVSSGMPRGKKPDAKKEPPETGGF